MAKIRVGILGTGSIVRRIMADFRTGDHYELTAFASRSYARAKEFCDRYGAKYAYGSYEELAVSPFVDLVYVASPHNFHKAHTLMMLRGGKHVICEKPFALNEAEADEMISLARSKGLFLMEAMWTRFLPAMCALKKQVDDGCFGDIYAFAGNFGYRSNFDPQSRVYSMALAGGSLMDVGVYPLSVAAYFLGCRFKSVVSSCVKAPTGADARFFAQIGFEGGATAQIVSAVDMATESRVMLYGSRGFAEIPDFWHATKFNVCIDGENETFCFPPENEGHRHEFSHAAACILDGKTESPIMSLDETREILRLMTKMRLENGIVYPEEQP